jgi:hypothetical protein
VCTHARGGEVVLIRTLGDARIKSKISKTLRSTQAWRTSAIGVGELVTVSVYE